MSVPFLLVYLIKSLSLFEKQKHGATTHCQNKWLVKVGVLYGTVLFLELLRIVTLAVKVATIIVVLVFHVNNILRCCFVKWALGMSKVRKCTVPEFYCLCYNT